MPTQRTIAGRITCTGIGLHTGVPVELVLSPAPPDTGIVFVRRRAGGDLMIPARAEYVCSTANATTLSARAALPTGDAPAGSSCDIPGDSACDAVDGHSVGTVEHLLAVLACRGVDNVRVEVDGPEIPVMDGSAEPFDYLIRSTGTVAQPAPRRVIRIRRPVEVVDPGDPRRRLRIEPARRFSVSYSVDFDHPLIGRQCLEVADVTPAFFQAELARARTFGFLAQVDALRRVGLARGASLANTVVLDDEGVMNEGGLRWPDEFVRHKLLDLLGDLALLGHPVRGHVHVERGGHGLHLDLLRELCARPDAWKLVGEPAPTPPVGVPADSVAPV